MHARASIVVVALVGLQDCVVARGWEGAVEVVIGSPRLRAFPRRMSTGLGVCLKKHGRAHGVVASGKALSYPGGTICVRPPGCVWSSDPVDAEFVSIDIDPRLLPEDAVFAPMTIVPRSAIAVASAAERVLDPHDGPAREEALVGLVDRLARLGLVHAHDTSTTAGEAAIARARERLGVALHEELHLDELAREVGCNKFLLLRAFRRRFGITPHALRVCMRIEAARGLLARGRDLAEVATQVGFADQSHFGRHFKRIVGLTPAEYRASLRRGVAR